MNAISNILNLVLAVLAAAFFLKFFRYKKFAQGKLNSYRNRIEEEISKGHEMESKYQSEITLANSASKNNEQIINSLREEIKNLRQEKEEESKLRLSAEKQMELAMQKAEDTENRIEDWSVIHEANMRDTEEIIVEAKEDLYERLSNLLIEKISTIATVAPNQEPQINDNVETILQSVGLRAGEDYFMSSSIPAEVRKSVPCEAFIIVGSENCAIIDNQSIRFFRELENEKTKNEQEAYDNFKKKIDRYLAYLTNPRYRSNVVNYFAMGKFISPKSSAILVMLLPSQKEINEFKKLGEEYLRILQKNQITLHSLKSIIDLVRPPL